MIARRRVSPDARAYAYPPHALRSSSAHLSLVCRAFSASRFTPMTLWPDTRNLSQADGPSALTGQKPFEGH
jgi:hypothetical protein